MLSFLILHSTLSQFDFVLLNLRNILEFSPIRIYILFGWGYLMFTYSQNYLCLTSLVLPSPLLLSFVAPPSLNSSTPPLPASNFHLLSSVTIENPSRPPHPSLTNAQNLTFTLTITTRADSDTDPAAIGKEESKSLRNRVLGLVWQHIAWLLCGLIGAAMVRTCRH